MKAYLAVTAALFGLLTIAHIWRIVAENRALATDPWFLLTTVLSALLCGWGARLLLKARTPTGNR